MAQVQHMAPPVGGDLSQATPPTGSLPRQVDAKDDVQANIVEQDDAGSGFEVLGLMRTTSRQDTFSRRRQSEIDQHISSVPEKDHDEEYHREYEEPVAPKRSSITGLGLRQKLKDKIPGVRPSKEEKGHQKHDSVDPDPDPGFEVLGLMKTNSRTSEDNSNKTPVDNNKPSLERHISSIPQDDNAPQESPTYDMSPKLKRHISNIPSHDYDSEDEEALEDEPKTPTAVDSGTAGPDFEVHGLMRMTTNDDVEDGKPRSPLKRPDLERHISRIPQHDDDDEDEDSVLKSTTLVKTISNIPGHDYDSEGERPSLS